MPAHRIAFAGFRHSHIFDLYQRALDHPSLEIAAAAEENYEQSLLPAKSIEPTHRDFRRMIEEVPCEIVALGGAYGHRGAQAIAALEAGRHVIADKPLCTSLKELEEIARLAQRKGLHVGLMLDLRDHGNWIALRQTILSGAIGQVQTATVSGQHPLLFGTRPGWYFEPGLHGGTLNDIAIHAVDIIPWLTGLAITGVDFARAWNAKAVQAPHFADCAQFALRLSNGGGVLGDVSYLAPDGCGYTLGQYWRFTLHGTEGMAETSYARGGVSLVKNSDSQPSELPAAAPEPGGYLEDFLAEISGRPRAGGRTTRSNLEATRLALELQEAAENFPITPAPNT
ncbi:MAG: Gfo/Idh/MocA family oxidoreductase [Terrimicrobiaceae bacterium]|nr:Gfo/Idh/MocA family oxidoreductase [Terrimicrobiaceae bacterium]